MAFGEHLWTACFSGYRGNKFPFPLDTRGPQLERLQAKLRQAVNDAAEDGYSVFYCGGAWGFDILAGETVLRIRGEQPGVCLRLALPCPQQEQRWPSGWRARLDALRAAADETTEVSPCFTPSCFLARNRFMVDHSSLLICYFDGQQGGTSYTVRYAAKKGVRVVNLSGG